MCLLSFPLLVEWDHLLLSLIFYFWRKSRLVLHTCQSSSDKGFYPTSQAMLSPTRAISLPAASDVLLARRGSQHIFGRALPAFSCVAQTQGLVSSGIDTASHCAKRSTNSLLLLLMSGH